VIPSAKGTSARLAQEADGYRSRVVAQAEGDAQRFRSVLAEYQKAPAVTRDRLYIDTMQQVYSNVSKVMVDSKSGSNLLYLPLDKLMQQSSGTAPAPAPLATNTDPVVTTSPTNVEARGRDGQRSRERDPR
jgi:membrane protease subunit HflK